MAKKEPRTVQGKVVAITGGARGIGRATAATLLRAGCKVAIGDLDPELTQQAAAELGGGALGLELDVTDRASFERFLDQVEERVGPIDVLINNAGIMPLGEFHDEPDETAIRIMDINVHGVITGTKLALRRLRPRRTGHIVNVASYVGKVSPAGGATYVASKHAVVGLTESVMRENRDRGIEFSIVMPAVVNTELGSGLPQTRGVQVAEPEEVAAAILDALRFPRLEVFVPKSIGPLHKATYVLPLKAQEAVAKAFDSERILLDADSQKRAAYEDRAARSEPKLDVPDEQETAQAVETAS
jgi:NAD(P)-dependent dehydrogenase (short-subunit alcohol dehydrogenase family)